MNETSTEQTNNKSITPTKATNPPLERNSAHKRCNKQKPQNGAQDSSRDQKNGSQSPPQFAQEQIQQSFKTKFQITRNTAELKPQPSWQQKYLSLYRGYQINDAYLKIILKNPDIFSQEPIKPSNTDESIIFPDDRSECLLYQPRTYEKSHQPVYQKPVYKPPVTHSTHSTHSTHNTHNSHNANQVLITRNVHDAKEIIEQQQQQLADDNAAETAVPEWLDYNCDEPFQFKQFDKSAIKISVDHDKSKNYSRFKKPQEYNIEDLIDKHSDTQDEGRQDKASESQPEEAFDQPPTKEEPATSQNQDSQTNEQNSANTSEQEPTKQEDAASGTHPDLTAITQAQPDSNSVTVAQNAPEQSASSAQDQLTQFYQFKQMLDMKKQATEPGPSPQIQAGSVYLQDNSEQHQMLQQQLWMPVQQPLPSQFSGQPGNSTIEAQASQQLAEQGAPDAAQTHALNIQAQIMKLAQQSHQANLADLNSQNYQFLPDRGLQQADLSYQLPQNAQGGYQERPQMLTAEAIQLFMQQNNLQSGSGILPDPNSAVNGLGMINGSQSLNNFEGSGSFANPGSGSFANPGSINGMNMFAKNPQLGLGSEILTKSSTRSNQKSGGAKCQQMKLGKMANPNFLNSSIPQHSNTLSQMNQTTQYYQQQAQQQQLQPVLSAQDADLKNQPFSLYAWLQYKIPMQDQVWQYIDFYKQKQGPFSSYDMDLWYTNHYFKRDLMIRIQKEKNFQVLDHFLSGLQALWNQQKSWNQQLLHEKQIQQQLIQLQQQQLMQQELQKQQLQQQARAFVPHSDLANFQHQLLANQMVGDLNNYSQFDPSAAMMDQALIPDVNSGQAYFQQDPSQIPLSFNNPGNLINGPAPFANQFPVNGLNPTDGLGQEQQPGLAQMLLKSKPGMQQFAANSTIDRKASPPLNQQQMLPKMKQYPKGQQGMQQQAFSADQWNPNYTNQSIATVGRPEQYTDGVYLANGLEQDFVLGQNPLNAIGIGANGFIPDNFPLSQQGPDLAQIATLGNQLQSKQPTMPQPNNQPLPQSAYLQKQLFRHE